QRVLVGEGLLVGQVGHRRRFVGGGGGGLFLGPAAPPDNRDRRPAAGVRHRRPGRGAAEGGEGAGQPGSPGCSECTVLTRRTVPRGRWTLAPPAGGPSRASPAFPPPRCRGGRKAELADGLDRSGSGHRRAASKRAGSIPALEDPRTLLRPGFIARPQPAVIEERWIRRPPRRRDGPDCKG